jgi:exonuclease SbcC
VWIVEHPNVMAEDVSEQLTTIEETILKIANQEKEIAEIALKLIRISITHAAEQLRLVLLEKKTIEMEHKVHVAKFIWAELTQKIVLFSYLKARTAIS